MTGVDDCQLNPKLAKEINIAGVQRQTSLLKLQTARAYQAANTGIEWALARDNIFCTDPVLPITLNKFTVTVTSTLDDSDHDNSNGITPYNENGIDITICHINSKAEYGNYGQTDYVSRTIEVTIHD